MSDWLQTMWKSAYIYNRVCFRFLQWHSSGTSYWTAELNTTCIIHKFSFFLHWFSAFTCLRSNLFLFFCFLFVFERYTFLILSRDNKLMLYRKQTVVYYMLNNSVLLAQCWKNARIYLKCLSKIHRENTMFLKFLLLL